MAVIPEAPISHFKILMMPSTDGFPYSTACLIPKVMTQEQADAILSEVTLAYNDEEQKDESVEWNWDEFTRRLEPHGFVFLEFERGKVWWDNGCTAEDPGE